MILLKTGCGWGFFQPAIDEKIQLGPRAQLNWMKGSSGGAGAKASESGKEDCFSQTWAAGSVNSGCFIVYAGFSGSILCLLM